MGASPRLWVREIREVFLVPALSRAVCLVERLAGLQRIFPNTVPHPGTYAIVGMIAFFAAAAKAPISTIIMISEMTGGVRFARAGDVCGGHCVYSLRETNHLSRAGQ